MNPRDQSRKVAMFLQLVNIVHGHDWKPDLARRLKQTVVTLDTPTLYILLTQYQVASQLSFMGGGTKTVKQLRADSSIDRLTHLLTEELARRFPDERTPR